MVLGAAARLSRLTLLVLTLALAGGCQNQDAGGGVATPQSPAASTPAAGDLAGHWRGAEVFGPNAYIQIDGTTIRMVYDHDDGRIVATLVGTRATGWWSEAPTRTAPDDAGDVEFTVDRAAGAIAIHGRWRYGTGGDFHDDGLELVRVDATITPAAAAKFADRSSFAPHP
jgi:hypothetical protein